MRYSGAIASVSSLIGGIIGIIMGVSGALLLSALAGWPTIVSLLSVLMALSFSGLVGIFFGFYPAYEASRLDPIDSLRYVKTPPGGEAIKVRLILWARIAQTPLPRRPCSQHG